MCWRVETKLRTAGAMLGSAMTEPKPSRYGSRKFLLSCFSVLSASVLVWFGHIESVGYVSVMVGTAGIYIAGNVYQKTTEATK